jgi:hypothetical protein
MMTEDYPQPFLMALDSRHFTMPPCVSLSFSTLAVNEYFKKH